MANVAALKKWAKGNKGGGDDEEGEGMPPEDEQPEQPGKPEEEEPEEPEEEEEHVDEDLVDKLTEHVDEVEDAIDNFPGEQELLTSPDGQLDPDSEASIEEILAGPLAELRDQLAGISWDEGQDMAERMPDVSEPALMGGWLFRAGQVA